MTPLTKALAAGGIVRGSGEAAGSWPSIGLIGEPVIPVRIGRTLARFNRESLDLFRFSEDLRKSERTRRSPVAGGGRFRAVFTCLTSARHPLELASSLPQGGA